MRGYDPESSDNRTIVLKELNPVGHQPYEPKLDPSPQQIAADGFETIVSGASSLPWSKDRDVTYETDDGYYQPMPWPY